MIKITISYNDFDDQARTEDFWFHLSQAEIAEWHLTYEGDGEDLVDYIKRIVEAEEQKDLIKLFKGLIVRSIGKRSEDGRRFEKSQDIVNEFMQTNAYSDFFMRLALDAEYAVTFFNGIMPKDMVKQALADADKKVETVVPAWLAEDRKPTQKELMAMSPEEMRAAYVKAIATK